MDISLQIQQQLFIWDMEKAAINLQKHGVSFEKACEVFFDPFLSVVDASDDAELREAAIGLTEDWQLLFVVHLLREGDAIRIISARPASSYERRKYEDQ